MPKFPLPVLPPVGLMLRGARIGWLRPALRAAVVSASFLLAAPLAAHRDPQAPFPSLQALQVDSPPLIDGLLDETLWERAQVVTGFIDARTHQPAALQTTTRVAYTDRELFVAVECLDDRIEEIRASERREDRSFTGDDWVEVHFDPGHSHRAKYAFFTNPLGTRADANEGPSGVFNYGWSADWEVAARILPDRWVFEMRIPFGVMNYQRRDGQTWGLNVTRQVRRTDALSFLSFHATDFYKPRYFGHLTGLDLAQSKFDRGWEITPYVSTRVDFNGTTDLVVRAGLDVSVRLTPSIRSSFALNPDFGQVEADEDTIELRDTERFLPEKRLFFREGDELMRQTHRLYYSRRFSEIQAGAQASGQVGGFSFNALAIEGDLAREGGYRGTSTVLRLLQDVGERSSLGYYLANSALNHGHAQTLGVDATVFLSNTWRLSVQAAGTDERLKDTSEQPVKDRTDYLGHAAVNFDRYPWRFGAGYQAISRGFNPLLGFIPRRNAFGPFVTGEYGRNGRQTWFKRIVLSPRFDYHKNDDGDTALRDWRFDARVVLANDLALHAAQSLDYHAPHHNVRTEADVTFFSTDLWRSMEVGWAGGEFEGSDYQEVFFAKPLRVMERWMFRPDFAIRSEESSAGRRETVWLGRLVLDFSLTDRMWIKGSFQQRNGGVHNLSLIYGWRIRPELNWHLVFNRIRDEATAAANSAFTKLAYTF